MRRINGNLPGLLHRRSMFFYLSVALGMLSTSWLRGQDTVNADRGNRAPTAVEGSALFARHCSSCHGADARGGDRAPNIATVPDVQQMSDSELTAIIRNGIPAAGMPAFGVLGADYLKALIDQLRAFQGMSQGSSAANQLHGNSQAGESLFFGKAQCSTCHMINGKGGFIASDLSFYGAGQSAGDIRRMIIDPRNNLKARSHATTVVTNDGKKVTGIVKNEDNFSLTLQTLGGSFRFFEKADVKAMNVSLSPLMPDNYGSLLDPDELNDLISYLQSVASKNGNHNGDKKQNRWDEDD